MSALLEKLKAAGTIKGAQVLSESTFFTKKDMITTDLPILNVAFSGSLDGGLVSGLTIIAGESKTYKTLLSLYCMRAYLTKYPEAIAVLWDSEFGITPEYLSYQGIDTNRVLHVPIPHLEALKFDMVKRLEEIKRGDKVFLMIDSLGALASKKEVDDAIDEKAVSDLTRAKSIRSLLRIITPHLTMKDIPCLIINHIYKTMALYSQNVISGGNSVIYSANQAFIISRAQDKNSDGDIDGWFFTINIEKSRFVREKSKLIFNVDYEDGINKFSGMLAEALESGHVKKPNSGWFAKVDIDTGEIEDKKYREKDTNTDDFWNSILNDQKFKDFIRSKYQLSVSPMQQDEE